MASSMTVTRQHLTLSGVGSITITEIVSADGVFTRAIRFFGESERGGAIPLMLDLTLTANEQERLEVSTPVLQF